MKDKRTLHIVKIALIILMAMPVILESVLWYRNGQSSYYVFDKKLIGEKIMLVIYLVLAVGFIVYTVKKRHFCIVALTLVNLGVIIYLKGGCIVNGLKFFMSYEAQDGLQYLKFDRVSVLMSILLMFAFFMISIYRSEGGGNEILWSFATNIGIWGMINSYDIVWMSFFCFLMTMGMYGWLKDKSQTVTSVYMVSAVLISLSAVFAAVKIEYSALQSIIACKAMMYEGSEYSAYLLLGTAAVIIFAGLLTAIRNNGNMRTEIYISTVIPVTTGAYLILRFTPAYGGLLMGNIVKYIGAVSFFVGAVCVLILKKKEWISVILKFEIIMAAVALMGVGIPLTVWYAVMLMIVMIPHILLLVLNEYSGRYIYITLVGTAGMILLPVDIICFRMSTFKAYLQMEKPVFSGLMIAGFVCFAYGITKKAYEFVKKGQNTDNSGRISLCIDILVLCALITFLPLITIRWINPMFSSSDLMLANIEVKKVPLNQIIVTAIFDVVVFMVPAIIILFEKMIKRNKKKADKTE